MVFRKRNEDLSYFTASSITFFITRADVFDCLITDPDIAASILRSGLSSDNELPDFIQNDLFLLCIDKFCLRQSLDMLFQSSHATLEN